MADDLDDGEFWLPSDFLTEEDILMDFDTSTTLSSSGFNSDLGSPVESVTETESDEDDFHLPRPSLFPKVTPPAVAVAVPVAVAKKGTGYFDSSRGLGKQSNPISPPNFHGPKPQVITPQFQALWNQQIARRQQQQQQQRLPPPLMSSAWPTVQRAVNRKPIPAAVFPGPPRESVGTGVFLPRNVNPTEPRKKSNNKHGGAAVLVPEKVVQALMNITPKPKTKSDSTRRVQGHTTTTTIINAGSGPGSGAGAGLDIQLPSEWTY